MEQAPSNPGAPRKILLATDLSARGDRALERAVAIATSQNAQLIIVHVFEELDEPTLSYRRTTGPSWQRPPDIVATAKQRIRDGLNADMGNAVQDATVLIEEGDPAEAIARIAASELVDLVVTGIAGERPFASRPVILGKTVEQLLRRLPVPVLIVKNRPRSAYQHVLVTTDFSIPSAHALQAALRFFPAQPIHLLHASDAPYASLAVDQRQHVEGYKELQSDQLRAFLASIFIPDADLKRIVPVVEPGSPALLVRDYVQMHGADLVVLGTHGRGAILEAIMGSTTKSILSTLPCDAMVMGAPR
jgi:nucleotide-binding universal stress UspA family protein